MEDQRIRLTKSMLKSTLLNLLEKKDIKNISVTELCKAASINRTTFYKYYGTPMDVLEEIAEEFFGNVEQYLRDSEDDDNPLKRTLEYLDTQHRVFRILVNTISDPVFTDRLFRIPRNIEYVADKMGSAGERAYVETFVFHGGYAVIRRWLNRDTPESAAYISRLLEELWEKME